MAADLYASNDHVDGHGSRVLVAINALIYLKPEPPENVVAAKDPAQFDNPVPVTTPEEPTHTPTSIPSPTPKPSPTLSPLVSPSPTPTPARVYKISGRVMADGEPFGGVNVLLGGTKNVSTTTDTNGK